MIQLILSSNPVAFTKVHLVVCSLMNVDVQYHSGYTDHVTDHSVCSDGVYLCVLRVGNMLFSVETQTTEERTQQYQSEIESIYKDLTAKGKALMLSTELGVYSLSSPLFFFPIPSVLFSLTVSVGFQLCDF